MDINNPFMSKTQDWWVKTFMPLIIKNAMPLRSLSEAKYQDGIGDGILMVIEAVTGQGGFDPTKGNIADYMKKALQGVRMEARKEAQAGTTSLDAIMSVDDTLDDDENFQALSPFEDEGVMDLDHEMRELLDGFRACTVDVVADPATEVVENGDNQNDRWLFIVPATEPAIEYASTVTVYEPNMGRPTVKYSQEITARENNRSVAQYPDDDKEVSQAFAVFAAIGERDNDHFEEDGLDEEGWLGLDLSELDGEDEPEEGMPLFMMLPHISMIDERVESEDGEEAEEQPLDEYGEEPDPDFEPAEQLDVAPRYFGAMMFELRAFELIADGLRHLAYVDWKDIKPVSVRAVSKKQAGLVAVDGSFVSMKRASGMAARCVPASGNVDAMLGEVLRAYPHNADAALFVRRIHFAQLLQ